MMVFSLNFCSSNSGLLASCSPGNRYFQWSCSWGGLHLNLALPGMTETSINGNNS